ncbi:MAG: type II toxin-antitoxin system Phd/YefM family antitoxin [Gammaproteobacteria bacterium]|jgi:antitoxin StbD
MNTIFADHTVSISDFKARPAKTVEDAADRPLAVLSHNKTVFYAISAKLFESIADILDDHEIAELVRARLANPKIVDVSLDDL